MRLWDAELLTRKTALQPVSSGLLLWLDAADEITGDTQYRTYTPPMWQASHMFDRVSNARVDFARGIYTGSGGSSGGLQQQGLYLYAAAPYGGGGQIGSLQTALTGVLTVEFVFKLNPKTTSPSELAVADAKFRGSGNLYYPVKSSVYSAIVPGADVITDAPVHIVCTVDADNYPLIYQNGVLASSLGTGPQTVSAYSVTQLICLPQDKYIGSIRLYNRALSATEIRNNYAYEISTGRFDT